MMNTDEKYCTRKDILMYFPVCENTYRKLEKLGKVPNVVGFDGRINLYDVSEVCKFLANPENYSTEVTPPRRKDGWRKTAKCRGCGKTFMPKKARKGKTEYCSSICYYDHKTILSKIKNECEFYDELGI